MQHTVDITLIVAGNVQPVRLAGETQCQRVGLAQALGRTAKLAPRVKHVGQREQ